MQTNILWSCSRPIAHALRIKHAPPLFRSRAWHHEQPVYSTSRIAERGPCCWINSPPPVFLLSYSSAPLPRLAADWLLTLLQALALISLCCCKHGRGFRGHLEPEGERKIWRVHERAGWGWFLFPFYFYFSHLSGARSMNTSLCACVRNRKGCIAACEHMRQLLGWGKIKVCV